MLSKRTDFIKTATMEAKPLKLYMTDDGRALVALAERQDGSLELISSPVAIVQDAVDTSLSAKSQNGFYIMSHQPVLGLKMNNILPVVMTPTIIEPMQIIAMGPPKIQVESPQNAEQKIVEVLDNTKTAETTNKSTNESSHQTSPAISKSGIKSKSLGRPKKSISSHTMKNVFTCEICGETFKKHNIYRKHLDQHAQEKPHRCPKCPASFNIPSNFTLHMATHNVGEPKCPQCGKKFARMASLKSHMVLHEKEENLFCTDCEDSFSTKAQLDAHMKLHNEKWSMEDVRKCKLCHKQFTQPALYRQHVREHYRLQTKTVRHTKMGTRHKTCYKCKICLKTFEKPSQLMRHIRVHTGEKPYKCNLCNRGFTQKGSVRIHMWQHNGIRPYSCSHCSAKFSQKGNLNAHVLRVHNAQEGSPMYRCAHCTCIFKKLGSLNGHMKKMHLNRQADSSAATDDCNASEEEIQTTVNNVMLQLADLESCVKNQASSIRDANGNDHNVGSSNVSPENDLFNKDDKTERILNANKTTEREGQITEKVQPQSEGFVVTKDKQSALVTLLEKSPDGTSRRYVTIKQRCTDNVRVYECSFCDKEFKKPSDLIRHLRIHTQEKPFKCSTCSRSFTLKSTMLSHQKTHVPARKFPCRVCDKSFSTHSSVLLHEKLHDKVHKCPLCGKRFTSNDMLRAHLLIHASRKAKVPPEIQGIVPGIVLEEPLVISDAGNKISVAHVQPKQRHAVADAEGIRPHKCGSCSAAFIKLSHLKQHTRRHTGERPFECLKCTRKFSSNSALKAHIRIHEESKPFKCSVCNAHFSTQSSLKRHHVTHSNKRPFMCPYCHKTFKTSVNCRKHMKIHRQEIAQRQLDQRKVPDPKIVEKETTEPLNVPQSPVPPRMISLGDEVQPLTPDLQQEFAEQFQTIMNHKEKQCLSLGSGTQDVQVVQPNFEEVETVQIGASHMLHADETGTVILPNYSDQTLTPESIREIEETLNQQLFNISLNLEMNNLRQVEIVGNLENQEQNVSSILYDNSKQMDASPVGTTHTNVFQAHFDSFDINQLTLQTDSEIDIGIEGGNSTNLASILPRSIAENRQYNGITSSPIGQSASTSPKRPVIISSVQIRPECVPKIVQISPKFDTLNINPESQSENSFITTNFPTEMVQSPRKANENFQNNFPEEPDSVPNDNCDNLIGMNSLLQCHMCNKKGFSAIALKDHLLTHQGKKKFSCLHCPMKFCTNGGLSRHVKTHAIRQLFKCFICEKAYDNKLQLKIHLKTHDNEKASKVELNGATSNNKGTETNKNVDTVLPEELLKRLDELETKKDQKEYGNKCKYCPKTFRKPSDLIRHVRTHTGEKPYQCKYCQKSFAVKCTLDSHLKVHSGTKTFCCHVCNSMFATKGSLKVHMRLHTGAKPFRCPMCDMKFRTSGHRKVHLLTHVREQKISTTRRKKSGVVAIAAEANKVMENSKEDLALLAAPQPLQPEPISNANTTLIYANDLTDEIGFNSDGMLSVHDNNQLVANLQFLLANGLVTIQTEDSMLPTQLPLSNLNMVQNDLVTTSTQKEGEGDLLYSGSLPQLNASTVDTNVLSMNGLTVLNNLEPPIEPVKVGTGISKPVKAPPPRRECEVCGKTFAKPFQLERHKRVHTGERPFKCELCTKSFAQKSTLQMHQKHHTGDRAYQCPHCSHSFTQNGNLQTHLNRVHKFETAHDNKSGKEDQPPDKFGQTNLEDTRVLNLDDISIIEFLK